MRLSHRVGWIPRYGWVGLGIVLAVAGCGQDGPRLASVTGVITLDGEPLPGAAVEFQPPGGSPSEGVTDKRGVYRLEFSHDKRGVVMGLHKVRISTQRNDSEDERGEPVVAREIVPARYNRRSELTAEVKPGGNVIDFALKADPTGPLARGDRRAR